MKRIRSEDCLSDLSLDMLRASELGPEAVARAHQHLEVCALCRAQSQKLARDAAEAKLPPLSPAGKNMHLHILPRPRRRRPWAAGLALAAAAVTLIVIGRPDSTPIIADVVPNPDVVTTGTTGANEPTANTRTKGPPTLMFHVKRDGVVREGGPNEVLHPGDVIRFSYSWSEPGSVAVLSRDGAGAISVYVSADERTLMTTAGEAVVLPGAVRLDDVTGPESFYGVFCSQPVATETLEHAIANHPENPVISGCRIDTVRVNKRDVF